MVKMGNTLIMPFGKAMEKSFELKDKLKISNITILTPEETASECKEFTEKAKTHNFSVRTVITEKNYWENFFRITKDIAQAFEENDDGSEAIMLTNTGNEELRSIATTAAFIAGIKAITIADNGQIELLPLFKFNYYSSLTAKKMDILRILENDKTCCSSLEDLSKKTKMSLPLISYHINGNLKSEGLKKMGLVNSREEKGKVIISISDQGRMLMHGYIDQELDTGKKK